MILASTRNSLYCFSSSMKTFPTGQDTNQRFSLSANEEEDSFTRQHFKNVSHIQQCCKICCVEYDWLMLIFTYRPIKFSVITQWTDTEAR